jgi:hypothetical protein
LCRMAMAASKSSAPWEVATSLIEDDDGLLHLGGSMTEGSAWGHGMGLGEPGGDSWLISRKRWESGR